MDSDVTIKDESTDGRLLKLEQRYNLDVRIYPGCLWEIIIYAHGASKVVVLKKTIDDKEFLLTDSELEHHVDLAIEDLRQEGEQHRIWEMFCERWGLK